MKKEKTKLPDGIPEENVYDNTHIMIYVFYAIAVGSVILLLVNQQLNNLSIYQEKILTLANQNKSTAHIEDFNCSYDMKNPMCGDEVKVRIKILQNKIYKLQNTIYNLPAMHLRTEIWTPTPLKLVAACTLCHFVCNLQI